MDDTRKIPAEPRILDLANPFGAPVYYRETVTSTMDEARALAGPPESPCAAGSAPHGTVIAAGYQSAGRGRSGRPWNMGRGESLPFTVILRYPDFAAVPPCLTLRTGLALSLAIEDFMEAAGRPVPNPARLPGPETLAGRVQVKWPNDIMLIQADGRGKKAAGILAETAGIFAEAAGSSGGSGNGTVYLGVGINVAQRDFPPELEKKACSIAGTLYPEIPGAAGSGAEAEARCAGLAEKRFVLLEKAIARLYAELEDSGAGEPGPEKAAPPPGRYPADKAATGNSWRERLLRRLYMRGKPVRFFPGAAGSGRAVEGILAGVGGEGELLITIDGEDRPFITGELDIY
ncbi:MAG: biotin--[acetyl-CoA-carboxylase] ligase family protein [Treponema sp.]|jgi:BirA family biotin operon repressor/biotin-[acetyl-CoA-carboxylase] ligase|nr:biotin--[acetyl-CoA-carboxylase] ligase family protein [Treponema sp.]